MSDLSSHTTGTGYRPAEDIARDLVQPMASDPEYTREEMREACLNNYNAGLMRIRSEQRSVVIDLLASLVAAVSLLKRGSKKAAPSNRMFDQMIADYERAIERGRAALKELDHGN